jgi:hypothetical protein
MTSVRDHLIDTIKTHALTNEDYAILLKTVRDLEKNHRDEFAQIAANEDIKCVFSFDGPHERVLGYALLITKNNNQRTNIKIVPEYVSFDSFFKDKIRETSFKSPTNCWIPLYINFFHMNRIVRRPHIWPIVNNYINPHISCLSSINLFDFFLLYIYILDTFILSSCDESGAFVFSTAHEKIYLSLYRMLLWFMYESEDAEQCKEYVINSISKIRTNASARTCATLPSIGRAIILAQLAGVPWSDISEMIVKEGFARTIRRIMHDHPHMELPSMIDKVAFITGFFKETLNLQKRLLFLGKMTMELVQLRQKYRHDSEMGAKLSTITLDISWDGFNHINTFSQFFKALTMNVPYDIYNYIGMVIQHALDQNYYVPTRKRLRSE